MICFGCVAGLQLLAAGLAAWRCFRQRFWFGTVAALLLAASAVATVLLFTSTTFWLPGTLAVLASVPVTVTAFGRADDASPEANESLAYPLLGATLLQVAILVVVGFGHVIMAHQAF